MEGNDDNFVNQYDEVLSYQEPDNEIKTIDERIQDSKLIEFQQCDKNQLGDNVKNKAKEVDKKFDECINEVMKNVASGNLEGYATVTGMMKAHKIAIEQLKKYQYEKPIISTNYCDFARSILKNAINDAYRTTYKPTRFPLPYTIEIKSKKINKMPQWSTRINQSINKKRISTIPIRRPILLFKKFVNPKIRSIPDNDILIIRRNIHKLVNQHTIINSTFRSNKLYYLYDNIPVVIPRRCLCRIPTVKQNGHQSNNKKDYSLSKNYKKENKEELSDSQIGDIKDSDFHDNAKPEKE